MPALQDADKPFEHLRGGLASTKKRMPVIGRKRMRTNPLRIPYWYPHFYLCANALVSAPRLSPTFPS